MRAHHVLLLVLVAMSGIACAPPRPAEPPPSVGLSGQTYKQAVETICAVDTLAQIAAPDDPVSVDVDRFAWLEEHVDNPEGIYLRTVLSVKTPKDRACLLRDAVREVGLPRCALADTESQRDGS